MLCRVIAQQMPMTNTHQMHIEVSRTCAQREHTRRSTRTPTKSEPTPTLSEQPLQNLNLHQRAIVHCARGGY